MPAADAPDVVSPTSEAQAARVLAEGTRRGLKVAPRGGGTKSDWGSAPERVDLVLSTLSLNRVLEHAAGDMTVTVEAGCTIAELQRTLAGHRQRLALDPLWPDRATVGGVLATNDSGSLRAAFGSLRDLVLGVTVALPDGTLARSGGKVVKNVAGYDLPKLMTGSLGTLGVITQATFRLHPLPQAGRTFAFTAPSPEHATRFALSVHQSPFAVTGLQMVAGSEGLCRVEVRVEGSHAGIEASIAPLAGLSAACGFADFPCENDPWSAAERLWTLSGTIARLTFLPSRLAELCAAIAGTGEPWQLVVQAVGIGLLATSAPADDVINLARRASGLGGSLLVRRGEEELKRRVNEPALTDALPLMRAVKKQFDPSGVLNPGRFGGGI